MSVYATKRSQSSVEFINAARGMRLKTVKMVRKMPKNYRWIVTNNILELAGKIVVNCIAANNVYFTKDISDYDYNIRHGYLVRAESCVAALLEEINFCYDLLQEGENTFKSEEDRDKKFASWIDIGHGLRALIRGMLRSDANRLKKYRGIE